MPARNPQVQNPRHRHSLSTGRVFDFYVRVKRFQIETRHRGPNGTNLNLIALPDISTHLRPNPKPQ